MKKILFIVFIAFLAGGKLTAQVKVVGNLTTNGPADTYPTHLDVLGYGGYRVVADITERNAIPAQRRKYGMLVYVQSDDNLYVLRDVALGNANWTNLSAQITPTSLGQLSNLSVSGVIEGGVFSGTLNTTAMNTITSLANVQALTVTNSINVSNIKASGTVTAGTLSGVLASGPQTGITQLGNLSALTVTNLINASNITVSGTVTAGTLSGVLAPGPQTGITQLGNLSALTVANSINASSISISGTVTAGTISSTSVQANRYLVNMNNLVAASSLTVDLSQGNVISLPLSGSTTAITLAFSNTPAVAASYVLKLAYSSATAITITWPASVKWSGGAASAPTLTCASGKTDIISFIWDGAAFYGTYALNF